MSTNRTVRIGLTVTAAAAIAVSATGITYAATAPGKAVSACANSKGTLRLLNGKGKCTKGYKKVAIAKQGPRGLTGAPGRAGTPGKTGAPGKNGAAGPGALSLSVDSTAGVQVKHSKIIGTTGLSVSTVCSTGDSAALYILDNTGASDWTIGGSTSFTDGGGVAEYIVGVPGGGVDHPTIAPGTSPANFVVPKDKGANFEIINRRGMVATDVLVARNGKTFSVQFSSQSTMTSCGAQVQVTPGQ